MDCPGIRSFKEPNSGAPNVWHTFSKKECVPSKMAWKRIVERFQQPANISPPQPQGRTTLSEELLEEVRRLVKPFQENQQSVSVSTIAKQLQVSTATIWRIMRKKKTWLETVQTTCNGAPHSCSQGRPTRVQRVAPPDARWL